MVSFFEEVMEMKVLVAYMSQSGNTRKVAQSIYEGVQGEKELKELSDLGSLEGYDLIFFGFPIQAFGPAEKARKFMEGNLAGRRVALFVTHASPEGSPELEEWLGKCREAAAGAEVVGMFNCQGELAADIMAFLQSSDDPKLKSFGELGPTTKGQPDEFRLEKAKAFARELTSL